MFSRFMLPFKSIKGSIFLSVFLCFVVLVSCNKDGFSPKDSSQIINNENPIDQFQLSNQLIIDKSFDKKTYKEYTAPSRKRVSYIFEDHEQSRRIYFHHNWINVDHDSKNEKYIVEFQTLNKDDKWSLLDPKGITGKVRIYNFNNEFIDYLSFEDGELIYSFNNSKFIFDAKLSGSRDVPPCNPALGGGGLGPGNTITTYVWAFTTTEHYTDWWDFNPLTNEYTFSNTQYNGSTLEVTQVACVDLSDDPSWNGEHYDIYKIEHIRKINEIDDDEKPDGSGKTLPVVIIDPCNPETSTEELAHEIVVEIAHQGEKGGPHGGDENFIATLSEQEYHQLQLEINELANSNLEDPCNNLSTNEIINEAIMEMEECTKSSFNNALGKALADKLLNCAKIMDESPNPCEEALVKAHPLAAYRIWLNSKEATFWTIEKFGNNGFGDCSDAFRHTFFNAINSQDVGNELALEFSNAHECNDSANDSVMDVFNNSIGHSIGTSFPDVGNTVIADRVCDRLESGVLKILLPDTDGTIRKTSNISNSHNCKCN